MVIIRIKANSNDVASYILLVKNEGPRRSTQKQHCELFISWKNYRKTGNVQKVKSKNMQK